MVTAPTFEWFALSPVVAVLAGACVGMLLEAFVPRAHRFFIQMLLMVVTILAAGGLLAANWIKGTQGLLAMGSVALDGPTYAMWAALLVFGGLAILLFAERRLGQGASAFAASASSTPGSATEALATRRHMEHSEVFPLALFSLSGMLVFTAASDLLTLFVALEVMSLPLYLLSGMARQRRLLSQESALKYFLLGAFASAFFLFGIALVYGFAGSFDITAIANAVASPTMSRGLLLAGVGLMAVGLLFKVGAVPFQSWVPDVYTGAPTPVTGFMAICTKLAAVGGLLRVFYVGLGGEAWTWQPVLAVVAVLTMVIGVVLALTQTDIKRLLAYSAVSHAGFLLTAVVAAAATVPAGQLNSLGSIWFYLVAYGFAALAAFGIVAMVRTQTGEANAIASWSGLGSKNPFVAGIFAFVMLSFAGIPLTAGFMGKWAVFAAAWQGGYEWLAITGVGLSLVAAYFYLRVIVVMFFGEPEPGVVVEKASALTWIPVIIGAVGSLAFGIFPTPLMSWISAAEVFIR